MISILAAVEMVVFSCFSFVLYLECITFTIVAFAMAFPKRISITAAFIFGMLNMILIQGVTPWSLCYLIIYPLYSWIIARAKPYLNNHFIGLCIVCGVLSFSTGQLLQIPFLLFSKYATIFYLIAGLKTSLIQGLLSFGSCMLLYKPVSKILERERL